jgi:hypothetical protein
VKRAWVLNLESDLELSGQPIDPLAALRTRPELVRGLVGTLVPQGDVVLGSRSDRADGLEGRAFSPTPRARALLASAGARPALAPDPAILTRVASRAFSASLGLPFASARLATSLDDVLGAVRHAPPSGSWLIRRVFGFAGKGRRLVRAGELGAPDRAFVARALAHGAVLVEPWVEVELDVAIHGFLAPAGDRLTLGEPAIADVGPGGVWRASRRAHGELDRREVTALATEARRVGDALAAAGFFGPFGLDGFRYREVGETRFVARCDLNPRYTMGWAIGMGDRRPDLDG